VKHQFWIIVVLDNKVSGETDIMKNVQVPIIYAKKEELQDPLHEFRWRGGYQNCTIGGNINTMLSASDK